MSTSNFAFPYPDINTDQPNGPAQMKALADGVDAALTSAKVGAGTLLNNTGLSVSTGSGWSSLNYNWMIRNGWTMLTFTVARVGSPISGGSTGNIANSVLATLSTNRPPVRVPGAATHAESGTATASLFTDGSVNLYAIGAGATVAVNDLIRVYFVYPA